MSAPTNTKILTLTPKQSKFIDEYLIDLNISKAALRAGYSPKTAPIIGWETMQKPHVKEELNRRSEKILEKTAEKRQWILKELQWVAEQKGELSPKTKSLELLGKYHAMWQDRIDVTTNGETVNRDISITFVEKTKDAEEENTGTEAPKDEGCKIQ